MSYRESLNLPVEVTYTHREQSGGAGQFAEVKVRLSPGKRGQGIKFFNSIKDGNIPVEFIPSIEKGMREEAEIDYQFGFPITDFNIELLDGKYHDLDSSALAFEIAGHGAMREGARMSGTKLLEAIMKVEVLTPEEFLGDVIGSLGSRRGQIQQVHTRGEGQVIEAMMPLAAMLG